MKMNILSRLALKNLRLNKKRTIGTLIGIILAVGLICAVTGMGTSARQTLINEAKANEGDWHFRLELLSEEKLQSLSLNRDIEKITSIYEIGAVVLPDSEDGWGNASLMSKGSTELSDLYYETLEGRFPENDGEIALNNGLRKKLGAKTGETITLNIIRKDDWRSGEGEPAPVQKAYKVVGIIKNDTSDLFNYAVTAGERSRYLTGYFTLIKPADYKKDIPEALGYSDFEAMENDGSRDFVCNLNSELLRWQVFSFSDDFEALLLAVIGVAAAIIMITSIFCIRNSFAISATEKMKSYGVLASVGATSRQIKKSVLLEALILSAVGVPLGILLGIFADFILIKFVNALLSDFLMADIGGAELAISPVSIISAALLGFLTVYLSARASARRVSKVSPVEQLRGNGEVSIRAKKLKCPKLIGRLFGTGGVIAYKNLKRSRKKYRTTVISITVSVFVFISMYSLFDEAFDKSSLYLENYDYNMKLYSLNSLSDDELSLICSSDEVEKCTLNYRSREIIEISDTDKIVTLGEEESGGRSWIRIYALDADDYKAYCTKAGVSYEKAKNKGIFNDYRYIEADDKLTEARYFTYREDDIIDGVLCEYADINETAQGKSFKIPIAKITKTLPSGLEDNRYSGGFLIVEKDCFENELEFWPEVIAISSTDAGKTADLISSVNSAVVIQNFAELARQDKAMSIVFSVFLYGFIAVISLIGITNIFNTITSNMELRQREFAMLKSVGMTKKEFNRMINLETLFYSSKSLLYGIIAGVLGSFAVHKAFGVSIESAFKFPLLPIAVSIFFVFALVFVIMRYSVKKISTQNIIETIRNENI